ncbi:MAG: DmsE family decaheme c-type cytochrome [Syntrophales bacterium]|nr:DmsE family decaheme c-type cytochrome [Syntrophales bacterium]
MGKIKFFLTVAFVFLFVAAGFFMHKAAEGETKAAGAALCMDCHTDQYNSYLKSKHSKKGFAGSPANNSDCIACHKAGQAHVEAGGGKGAGGIVSLNDKKVPAETKNAVCLACHKESKHLASWNIGKHKSAGVSCNDCHSSHSNLDKNLKAKQPGLCFNCHRDIKSQANKQSHHPMKEGKVACTDCHDPHGEFGNKMVKADTVNELCYKCHAEKRGPYMVEHPPVEENCLTCHTPHGSNHNKLLSKKMPQLCQSCHDWTRHPGTAYTSEYGFEGSGSVSSRNKLIARSCLNCHTNIHGGSGVGRRGPKLTR